MVTFTRREVGHVKCKLLTLFKKPEFPPLDTESIEIERRMNCILHAYLSPQQ